jgi:hypothetical protein
MLRKYIRKPSECDIVFGINYITHAATVHGVLSTGDFPLIVPLNTVAVTLCVV